MNSKHTAVWFVVAALAAAGSASAGDIKTVSVEGEAAIVPGDLAATEAAAKTAARRNAIEQGAGVSVSSASIMKNYGLVSDEVTAVAKGVITDEQWGPLTDGPTGSTKKIKLSAKVSPDAVPEAICTILKANHDPKVSLVFVEKFGDEDKWSTERGLVEAIFTNAFVEGCFTIVESGVKVTEISANGDLPQSAIQEIVKNSDAQYVVLGSGKFLKAKQAPDSVLGDKMHSYSMSASLKMINTATNEIEAVSLKQLQVMGISPEKALEANDAKVKKNLTGAIMDDLMKKIGARWTSDMVNTSKVSVQVQNVANYAAAKAFKDLVVSKLKGKAEQRKVSGGSASFDIDMDGGAEAFAAAVEGKKAGKYTVEVIEVTRGKVILKLNG
jgi:hypothetical protein